MQPLHDVLAPWHDFYTVLGEASATMTGLLFVAASVGSGIFTRDRPGALRMFLSASVVQFATTLFSSLVAIAPLQSWHYLGGLILGCGLFGLAYSGIAWRGTVRDGIAEKIDLEDRFWYAAAPAAGYFLQSVAGVALILRSSVGCATLAAATGCLLLAAIHNAWDITIWSVTRRKD